MNEAQTFQSALSSLGLDLKKVEKHQRALKQLLSGTAKKFLTIEDTCRLENGGILKLAACVSSLAHCKGSTETAPFTAFVPAAGAASRYIGPLADLEQALEDGHPSAGQLALEKLRQQGATTWPLPTLLARLILQPETFPALSAAEIEQLKSETALPKALMPCVSEGTSFLALKRLEHQAIPVVKKECFIAPPGQSAMFLEQLEELQRISGSKEYTVLEQHGGLSTIRFNRDGSPYYDKNGHLSLVPAGHGTLSELFPLCAGSTHSLFIRNIDNIMGTDPGVVHLTADFLSVHDKILTLVKEVRAALAAGDPAVGETAAHALNKLATSQSTAPDAAWIASTPHPEMWGAQARLFHSALPEVPSFEYLQQLYGRPVTTLGQVPNTGADVGGTPCFVAHQGQKIKICVEVPHASPADKDRFFTHPEKATHFNPVFAAAEITADPMQYQRRNDDFWLMAEKTYRGTEVIYYETVLYELIGNSTLANSTFIEVPRSIFNPHKKMSDAATSSIKRWIS